ncbi:phosphatase DCR2 [Histoplasma capsulatum G186AR]|uniref:Phosphatase DCR2 n=2 Tax=Ajellomyces capsulatus TaxID=5037 RepID=C0NN10_AJECG|nr:phosphatase DCR2 [Histoplasma capsulatum G186AR]EEH07258.1 phosphatase DCR2 [Histoplasma capsulatum G186AR]KAG5304618.1 phosphatase DCR2 [Histoplasma capsulatum]QSS70216.1 phosphatase DCR2 [Histoplasma capsulatum G186AR]
MVTRRIVRTGIQLGLLALIILLLLFIFDNKLEFLPAAIHDHLPAHHPGLVVTDVTVTTCSSINIFSSCTLDPVVWHRIEKDLYLGTGWTSSAYTHIQRKKEEDLLPTDSVVIDLKIGKLDPGAGTDKKWEARPAGIWLLRTDRSHTGDPQKVITSLDVLFGADAADPRTGWEVKDTPLLLDTKSEARLSIRRGPPAKLERPPPRIRKDGRFKIMQASDLHLSTGLGKCREPIPHLKDESKCEADPRTLEFLERMLDEEKPDLVIISGDQVNGDTAPDAATAIFKLADIFVKRRIPYAAIFGNHDDEGNLDRSQSMALLQQLPYSLSEPGPVDVDGVGNYIVEVLDHTSSHSALSLYLLDTHSYSPDERRYRGYDWIKPNQIEWFKSSSERLQKSHREYRYIHMNLAFIHIPLPEYRDRNSVFYGNWTEPSTAPRFNSGFRDALVSENVVVVSCGHDHVNDYCMLSRNEYSQPSLWMCYAGGAGFGGYGGYGGYIRRVRFFDINMNSARIMTYKRLEYGDTASKINEMMIVDGGKVVQSD